MNIVIILKELKSKNKIKKIIDHLKIYFINKMQNNLFVIILALFLINYVIIKTNFSAT